MKLTQNLLLVACLFLYGITARAQSTPQLPSTNGLSTKEDYAKYETVIVQSAEWLENTPLDAQPDTRDLVSAFVLQWLTGSPNVTITFTEGLTKPFDKNPRLLPIFSARYAAWCITNNTYNNVNEPTKAGLTAIAKVYQKDVGVHHAKAMDKLVKAIQENTLDDYMSREITQQKK